MNTTKRRGALYLRMSLKNTKIPKIEGTPKTSVATPKRCGSWTSFRRIFAPRPWKAYDLPDPGLSFEVSEEGGAWTLAVTAQAMAFFVTAEADVIHVRRPGIPRQVDDVHPAPFIDRDLRLHAGEPQLGDGDHRVVAPVADTTVDHGGVPPHFALTTTQRQARRTRRLSLFTAVGFVALLILARSGFACFSRRNG